MGCVNKKKKKKENTKKNDNPFGRRNAVNKYLSDSPGDWESAKNFDVDTKFFFFFLIY